MTMAWLLRTLRGKPPSVRLRTSAAPAAELRGRVQGGISNGVILRRDPSEVHKAFEVNSGHLAIEAMLNRTGHVVYPAGDWQALINELPEIAHQPVS